MQMCPECSANNKDTARFCVKCGAPLRKLKGGGTILIGRYRLERVLGCGGMGAVYLATDLRLKTKVAVKENSDTSSESRKQFETEARILSTLRHSNLPRVQDFFVAEGRQYLVMDYIDGESLEDIVKKRGPLPPREAIKWLSQVMRAIQYLHSRNPPIIHRDIKPANIKIGRDGRAYLVDFGIAKVLRAGSRTQAGARAITPGYSPPEQYGMAPTDQRSDIYALGATFYFTLTGRVPPEAIERITGKSDKLIPPRNINPTIPPFLEKLILKAMNINREERFSSIEEMIRALQTGQMELTRQPETSSVPSRPSRARQSFPPPPLPTGDFTLAPVWLRSVAFALDILIWGAAAWVLTLSYAFALSVAGGEDFGWVWGQLEQRNFFPFTLLLGFIIYRAIAHALTDRTIGKAMVGLKIVVKDEKPCSFWRALAREIAFFFSALPLFLGIFWAVLDPYKQGWHDLVAGTFVIRESEQKS